MMDDVFLYMEKGPVHDLVVCETFNRRFRNEKWRAHFC